MYHKLIVLMLFAASLAAVHGSVNQVQASTGHSYSLKTRRSKDLLRLIRKLRAHGTTVVLTRERVEQPFFSPSARIVNINGEGVQVFEYSQVSAADKEAMLVNSDGMSIGTTRPSWMAPPHFFKTGRLIVLYVGNEQTILKILEGAIGRQFAGTE